MKINGSEKKDEAFPQMQQYLLIRDSRSGIGDRPSFPDHSFKHKIRKVQKEVKN